MKNQIQLRKISDNTLLDEVKVLVQREKEIVAEVIEYLKEIELRKLHLARGYSSLFAFATDFLGYSEAEAHIRIQAARLTQALPEVKAMIEVGELSLSVAAAAQTHFRKENLRRKEAGKTLLTIPEKLVALELIAGNSRRDAERNLNTHFAQPSTRCLSFNADQVLVEKIEKLMDLMAHKNFDRDIGKMVELLVDGELKRLARTVVVEEPEDSRNLTPESQLPQDIAARTGQAMKTLRSRYIPQKTKSLVWAKYEGKCNYRDPWTGRKCDSTHGIQIDHQLAFAKGGENLPENLTLLCPGHNSWKGNRLVE